VTQPSRDALLALVDKYARMAELRRSLPPHPTPAPLSARPLLRQLAADYPGALRELDRLPTDEIDARHRALTQALEGGPAPVWAALHFEYHAWMRLALAVRRDAPMAELAELALIVEVVVDETLLACFRRPPRGRLMAAVFERIAERRQRPAAELWSELFPRRSTK
jgi:hypothetical protein